MAWLSTLNEGPQQRFTKYNNKRYGMVDLTVIAENYNDLIDGQLMSAISLDEYGEPVDGNYESIECGGGFVPAVWTNTLITGEPAPLEVDCSGWTTDGPVNADAFVLVGIATKSDLDWTEWCGTIETGACNYSLRLFCFQQ